MGGVGEARHWQGRNAEADSLMRTSLVLKRQLLPEGHPEIAWHLFYSVLSLREQARYAEAQPFLTEAWDIAARLPKESAYLKHQLAQVGSQLYSGWQATYPPASPLAKEWQTRLDELEREHAELRGK